jgi:hypothetical protein
MLIIPSTSEKVVSVNKHQTMKMYGGVEVKLRVVLYVGIGWR